MPDIAWWYLTVTLEALACIIGLFLIFGQYIIIYRQKKMADRAEERFTIYRELTEERTNTNSAKLAMLESQLSNLLVSHVERLSL